MPRFLFVVANLNREGPAIGGKELKGPLGWVEAATSEGCGHPVEWFDEVWVHGMWLPRVWGACRMALRAGKRLVRMTHGSLSPIYLERQSKWKKRLVSPIERHYFAKCDRVVVTGGWEEEWCRKWGLQGPFETVDLKVFFDFSRVEHVERVEEGELHLLYLGRRHPLKGVEYLEKAVAELNSNPVNPVNPVQNSSTRSTCSTRLKIVSSAFGEELEKVWDWCDVLVLPTLSDNFGLVIAEALERGKRVITTDGAPAWGGGLRRVERVESLTRIPRAKRVAEGDALSGVRRRDAECAEMFSRVEHVERVEGGVWSGYEGRLIYLKGYRDGTDEERVELLKKAMKRICK